jgi:hypothetical protein
VVVFGTDNGHPSGETFSPQGLGGGGACQPAACYDDVLNSHVRPLPIAPPILKLLTLTLEAGGVSVKVFWVAFGVPIQ